MKWKTKIVIALLAALMVSTGTAQAQASSEGPRGKTVFVGVTDSGDVIVRAIRRGPEAGSSLFRFKPSGEPVPWFTKRTQSRFEKSGSVTVVGNSLLFSHGRRVVAVGVNGKLVRGFGESGQIEFDRHVVQVAGDGVGGFYAATGRGVGSFRLERFDASGSRKASRWVGGQARFRIEAASPFGVAFVDIGEASDYGVWEDLAKVRADLKGRTVGYGRAENYSFGDVVPLKGGRILIEDADRGTVVYKRRGGTDRDFGTNGHLYCGVEFEGTFRLSPELLAADRSGRIVAADTAGSESCGIERYLPDGSPDPSFDEQIASANLPRRISDLMVTPSRILVTRWEGAEGLVRVVGYRPNGALDEGFGSAGSTKAVFRTR